MAYIATTYTFSNGAVADASQVNQNYTDIISGLSDGTKDLNMNAATFAGNLTANGNIVLGNASSDTLAFTGAITLGANSTLTAAVGAFATPSINFTSSTTTGLSCAAADTLIVSTAATARMTFSSGGLVGIGKAPSASRVLDVLGQYVRVINTTATNTAAVFEAENNNSQKIEFGVMGSTASAYGARVANDGYIYRDGLISIISDGSSRGIKFCANGTGALSMSIDGSGLITTLGQIKFPATQNPSSDANTLDDYEEGTWTPSVGGTATYGANNSGYYTKIGNTVFIRARIYINAIGTGSTNTCGGLPFTSSSTVIMNSGLSIGYFSGLATNVVSLYAAIPQNSSDIYFYSATSAQATLGASAIFQNSALVDITGSYLV